MHDSCCLLFVELGANIGWFTLLAASRGHHVMAIEASPCNTRVLKASIQMNNNDHTGSDGHFSNRISLKNTVLAR